MATQVQIFNTSAAIRTAGIKTAASLNGDIKGLIWLSGPRGAGVPTEAQIARAAELMVARQTRLHVAAGWVVSLSIDNSKF